MVCWMADAINGTFEILGSFFILMSVIKLHKDKQVKGVDWKHVAFFTLWGVWNLHYYPTLNQRLSFYGGIAIVAMNAIWVVQLLHYTKKKQKEGK